MMVGRIMDGSCRQNRETEEETASKRHIWHDLAWVEKMSGTAETDWLNQTSRHEGKSLFGLSSRVTFGRLRRFRPKLGSDGWLKEY